MNIDLHIEQLILHQCAPGDRERIGAAVRRELERLIAERGLSPSMSKDASVWRADAGGFEVVHEPHAQNLGEQIARAAYGGLTRA